MEIVEVDPLSAQQREAAVAAFADVLRRAVDAGGTAVRRPDHADLGSDSDAAPMGCGRAADQRFAQPIAVDVRSVEEIHAQSHRPQEQIVRTVLVHRPVAAGEGGTAEPDGGDVSPCLRQDYPSHATLSIRPAETSRPSLTMSAIRL